MENWVTILTWHSYSPTSLKRDDPTALDDTGDAFDYDGMIMAFRAQIWGGWARAGKVT